MALAPLDGVTDYVFREIIALSAAPDVFFTEFTNTHALLSKGYEKTVTRLKFSENQRHIVAQIWGTEPSHFYKVAGMVKEVGFDGVDINMGCPVHDVMKLGSGSSLIKNPNLAAEMIAAAKEGAKGMPVSVKTRIGLNSIVTETWIAWLLKQKPAALTVHGRTAKELSKVPVHWDEIGKSVKLRDDIAPETIIIGNGDITSREQALQVHNTYHVDGVMIGKGVFYNPWVFEKETRNHTTGESLQLMVSHIRLFCQTYPEPKRFAAIKKYFKIYVKSFNGADDLKKQLMETTSLREVEKLVEPYITS